MRLGLVSDIHSRNDLLEQALKLLDRQGVDQILCAGDVVDRARRSGPRGEQAVRMLRQHAIPCVRGNHDEWAISDQMWLRRHLASLSRSELGYLFSEETVDYLRELPSTLTFAWEGKRVMLAHGAPWGDYTCILPFSPEQLFRRVAQESETEVVVVGHTHQPMLAHVEGVWIVNPGAVCGDHTARPTCAILTLPDCSVQVFDVTNGQAVAIPLVEYG